MSEEGPSGYTSPPPIDELTENHRHILRTLATAEDAPLRIEDIHHILVEIEGTGLRRPESDDEREDVQNEVHRLHNTGLADSPENSTGWVITRVGSLLVDEIERAESGRSIHRPDE